mmetsp:Transcript_12244/g.35506  ORF Transcript_12244/g.35506 Transcript_12244/m.35506 type:complete len:350 (-) Transcript_12244:3630-4679(-)
MVVKADFSQRLGFFGRSDETTSLHNAFRDVIRRSKENDGRSPSGHDGKNVTPAVLLWGQSGTGKSCLVDQFIKDLSAAKDIDANGGKAGAAEPRRSPPAKMMTAEKTPADKRKLDDQDAGDVKDGGITQVASTNVTSSTTENKNSTASQLSSNRGQFYFIQGKHDEHTGASDPFSAIVQALKDLSNQIRSQPHQEIQRLRACVKEAVGDDVKSIMSMMPSLSVLLDYGGSDGDTSTASRSNGSSSGNRLFGDHDDGGQPLTDLDENAWNRLQYSFLQFIKAIATPSCPLILFLDDLQWASQVTGDLLTTLLLDPSLKYVFFIGAIRQDANPHSDNPNDVLALRHDAPIS